MRKIPRYIHGQIRLGHPVRVCPQRNGIYNNKPVLKENFPENAELVAFTYYRYEMFMEKIRNTTIKNPSIDKDLALFQENEFI